MRSSPPTPARRLLRTKSSSLAARSSTSASSWRSERWNGAGPDGRARESQPLAREPAAVASALGVVERPTTHARVGATSDRAQGRRPGPAWRPVRLAAYPRLCTVSHRFPGSRRIGGQPWGDVAKAVATKWPATKPTTTKALRLQGFLDAPKRTRISTRLSGTRPSTW